MQSRGGGLAESDLVAGSLKATSLGANYFGWDLTTLFRNFTQTLISRSS